MDLKSATLARIESAIQPPTKVGKFTKLTGARVDPSGDIHPDGFGVIHKGKKRRIRLLAVNSPTSNGTDGGDPFEEYFGVTKRDFEKVRREAVTFCKELFRRPMTVYLSDQKSRDRNYAYVEIDGSLLSSLLVEHGFAMIDDPTLDLPTIGGRTFSGVDYSHHLQNVQKEAKALKLGAWKYHTSPDAN